MPEPAWLSICADIASLSSLIITVVVWSQVREIRRSVARNARIPEAIKDLERITEAIRVHLAKWPDSERQLHGPIAEAQSVLSNLSEKLTGQPKKVIQSPLKLIVSRKTPWGRFWSPKGNDSADTFWAIHYALLGATEGLRQLNKDYKKRS